MSATDETVTFRTRGDQTATLPLSFEQRLHLPVAKFFSLEALELGEEEGERETARQMGADQEAHSPKGEHWTAGPQKKQPPS